MKVRILYVMVPTYEYKRPSAAVFIIRVLGGNYRANRPSINTCQCVDLLWIRAHAVPTTVEAAF